MTLFFANDARQPRLHELANEAGCPTRSALLDAAISGSGCIDVDVGAPIGIQNGNDLNRQVGERFGQLVDRIVYAPVVYLEDCPSNPRYNRIHAVDAFVSFTIDEVAWSNGSVPPGATCPGGYSSCMKLTLRCDQEIHSRRAGCGRAGMQATSSQLVQ
jgi:hypothetical protein